jgi:hypothetical protein
MEDGSSDDLATMVFNDSESGITDSAGDFPPLDPVGWVSLGAGLLVILITFFTSYSHVDLFGFLRFKINQQIGIPLLLAAMAALVGEVKLASNNRRADQSAREREARERKRAANEADRERDRAAEEREQTARRAGIQARFLVAQSRFLLSDTARNRLQLNEALALLLEEPRLL